MPVPYTRAAELVIGMAADLKQFEPDERATVLAQAAEFLETTYGPSSQTELPDNVVAMVAAPVPAVPHVRTAMFAAKKVLPPIKKNTVGAVTKDGKEKYRYAPLHVWWPDHQRVWFEHDIDVSFGCDIEGDVLWYFVEFTSMVDGSSIRRRIPFNYTGNDPQAQGSWLTYDMRYVYCNAVGIVPDPDDDGEQGKHDAKGSPPKRQSARQNQGRPQGRAERLYAVVKGQFPDSQPGAVIAKVSAYLSELKDMDVDLADPSNTPNQNFDKTLNWLKGEKGRSFIANQVAQEADAP